MIGVWRRRRKREGLRGEKGPRAGLQEQPREDQEEKRSQEKGRVGPNPTWCALVFCYFWTLLETINFFFEGEVAQGGVISLS